MNFDVLRQKILEKAIRGELVPQLESEPEVEQIGEAPEEVPFEIPKKWKWFKLDKLVSVISGTSYKPNDISSEGIRIIRGGNIENFKVSFKPDDVFLPKSFKEEKLIVKSTDIVIVASTGSLEVIGKPGVISEDLSGKCQIGAFLRIIRPKQTEFSQYLKFIFMSDFYRCRIRRLVKGTNIRNIKKEYIADMVIPLPPLAEQRRIVARLNDLLALIETADIAYKDLHSLCENFRAKLIQKAIEGKLVPQLESEPEVKQIGEAPEEVPFEIPKKWKWVAIGAVCVYIQRGKSPKYSEIQKIPVVAQKCNQWDGFHIEKAKFIVPETASSYNTERWLQDKDVLWNSTGLGTLGRVALYKKQLNPYGCAVADSHVTVMRCSSSLLPEYLYCYICSPSVQSVVEEISDGSTKQKELATKTIREFQLPLPPLAEQHRIVARVNELLSLLDELH